MRQDFKPGELLSWQEMSRIIRELLAWREHAISGFTKMGEACLAMNEYLKDHAQRLDDLERAVGDLQNITPDDVWAIPEEPPLRSSPWLDELGKYFEEGTAD